MEEKSEIAEWYKGQSIFITGGTGFMGKVLLEKLLYSCSGVEAIYVLMRQKRGKSQKERLNDIFQLPLFERVHTTNPEVLDKIIPISGEISMENLGISPEDRKLLIEKVSVVFHFAATLRLEAQMTDSLEMNTAGSQKVIMLAREMKNLKAFIHLSTAFCSADIEVLEEKVYPSPADPEEVLRTAKWMSKEALVKATPTLIKPHPNTYTYTKRLTETLVANEHKNMRVAIVRPSIVTPAISEPLPGWVDSLNGPIGVMVAAGKGVLRAMHCHEENPSQMIPVDIAIKAILVIAWKLGSASTMPEEVPVYNLTNDEILRVTWGDVLEMGRDAIKDYPFEMQVWIPNGGLCRTYWQYMMWSIFVHWIPAVLIDILLFIFRQERIMIRVQKKIYNGLELLQFFTTRAWNFRSQNFINLTNDLHGPDKEIFEMNFFKSPKEEYMLNGILGGRQYCLKEKLSSLPRCRIQYKVLYVVDKLFKLLLIYGVYCMAWSYSDTVKNISSLIGNVFTSVMNSNVTSEEI